MSFDTHLAEVNQIISNLSEAPTPLQYDLKKLAEAVLYLLENANIKEVSKV